MTICFGIGYKNFAREWVKFERYGMECSVLSWRMLYSLKTIVGVGAYFATSELWLQIRESNSLLSGYEPDVIPYHPSAIWSRTEDLNP